MKLRYAAKCHCDVCLKEFDYKYRYERHVETTFHKDKVRLMEIVPQLRIWKLSLNLEMFDTGGSSTVTKSHSPSAIAITSYRGRGHWPSCDEVEKDSDSSSGSGGNNLM